MPVTEDKINQYQYPHSINRRVWDTNYTFENFIQNPTVSAVGGGASSGSTGAENVLQFNYTTFEYHILGAGQTITGPVIADYATSVSSLNPELDLIDDEGIEICPGILTSNPSAFKIGAAPDFFFRVRVAMSTVASTDDCSFGFREAEAYQANLDDYTDMAVLNVISGDINIETILNNAGTTTTDTTDDFADAELHEFRVTVSSAGVVTYEIDGAAPTVTAAYTFTDGLYVVPFFYFLHAASAAAGLRILEWESGFVS